MFCWYSCIYILTHFANKIQNSYIEVDSLTSSESRNTLDEVSCARVTVRFVCFSQFVYHRFGRRNCAAHHRVWRYLT